MASAGGAKSTGLWPMLAGAPFALWFGAGLLHPRPVPAAEPVAGSPAASAPASSESAGTPSQYCVSRLLSPFRAMAGSLPAPVDTRTDTTKITIAATATGAEALSAPARLPVTDWLDRVTNDVDRLRTVFGVDGKLATVQAIIATLPDPVDTGLNYEFDLALRSFRRGFEHPVATRSFFRDRGWLPWDDREVETAKRHDSEECRLALPGVMLFRGDSPERAQLLVLLLAGESPTSGLRQASLLNALRLQARIEAAGVNGRGAGGFEPDSPPPETRSVRVIGPIFSGSAQSLRLGLRSFALESGQALRFDVISGTATGANLPRWLGLSAAPAALTATSTVRFGATIVPEATVECAYLSFLRYRLSVPIESGWAQAATAGPVPLAGVATLSESGTEFGASLSEAAPSPPGSANNPPCSWTASSSFHFPFHVSALRDAYESLDRRDSQANKDSSIARATSLDAPLREARRALDPEADPSDKTRAAVDVALNGLIEQLSTRQIRHVAIHATDVGDAIFLARKIRDIAPDVRLAFFDADALLLHPTFQREVIGSLVVSPYPFFGLSDFVRESNGAERGGAQSLATRFGPSFESFESGHAEGLYNAVLAQRSAKSDELSEYSVGSNTPLPIWIATIARGSLLPNRVTPTLDCAGLLYGAGPPDTLQQALCDPKQRQAHRAHGDLDRLKKDFREAHGEPLRLDAHFVWPRAWDFLFVVLCLAFYLDTRHQSAAARRFSRDEFPKHFEPANDQQLDRAIARTKWQLYAGIRSFVFLMALGYMSIAYALGALARGDVVPLDSRRVLELGLKFGIALGFSVAAALSTWRNIARFLRRYRSFARCVGATLLPWLWRDLTAAMSPVSTDGRIPSTRRPESASPAQPAQAPVSVAPRLARILPAPPSGPNKGFVGSALLSLGFFQAHERQDVARTSFAQLRVLALFALLLAVAFTLVLLGDTAEVAELSWAHASHYHRLTLTALRAIQLTSGVSPSAPALLCMTCVYVWAAGRMARLALAHSISRASPADGETDLVSTPIRLILYPGYAEHATSDAGFTDLERDVLNAIWRPLTGRYYTMAALTLGFFPLVLFTLKPFSTLEGHYGTWFLGMGLSLSASLVGFTLVQLVQYWVALERLLERLLEHPLGPAFSDVPHFARDSLDQLLSGSSDDVLRWAGCARQFNDLQRSAGALQDSPILQGHLPELTQLSADLCERRIAALSGDSQARFSVIPPEQGKRASLPELSAEARDEVHANQEAALARQTIRAASQLTTLLEPLWGAAAQPAQAEVQPARISGQVELSWANAGGGSLAFSTGPQTPRESEEPWPAPRAVALVTGSSMPPPAPQASQAPGNGHPASPAPRDALSPIAARYSPVEMSWLRSAQVFAATVVTLLIHRHLRQFRHFLYVTTGCSLLLLLAVTSYSFEPYRLLLTFLWVMIGSVVATGLGIFIQMDRNTLVSHLVGSPPDQLTWNGAFLLRVLGWVVVPVVSVAAAQYPQLANFLFELIGPFARSLH